MDWTWIFESLQKLLMKIVEIFGGLLNLVSLGISKLEAARS